MRDVTARSCCIGAALCHPCGGYAAGVSRIAGLDLTDHRLTVPLDHDRPDGESIEVYARVVSAPDGHDRPFLVYLQGGPGQEAPRPDGLRSAPSWLARALQDYRVVMLDQRGTGRSTPYGLGLAPDRDAEYLTHFRADSIVRDAECLREHLGADRWSLLGQSFGGFCTLHYLSTAADSVAEAFFTGGLPPVGLPVDDIYSRTYDLMRDLNVAYHRRFPGDADRLRTIVAACDAGEVLLPNGDAVSARRFRTIGSHLGMDGGDVLLHFLLERDHRSPGFAHDLANLFPFQGRAPLYAVIHESSYADGVATRWSSQRCLPDDFDGDSQLLTGEHLYPWHFTECSELAAYRDVAEQIAEVSWPRLYDADVLRQVDVPAAAAIYVDDPFVDLRFSEQTAALLPHLRPWITNEYLHSGLRTSGGDVLDHLIDLARGRR